MHVNLENAEKAIAARAAEHAANSVRKADKPGSARRAGPAARGAAARSSTPRRSTAPRGLGVSRADFLSLTKFRLSALVIITTFFGFWLNSRDGINLALLLQATNRRLWAI